MIVYTSVFGNKDKIHPPIGAGDHRLVCFTDSIQDVYGWEERPVEPKYNDPRLDAKYYKLHPHKLFPGECTMWVDGNYVVNLDHLSELETEEMILFEHPSRSCAYDEIDFLLNRRGYWSQGEHGERLRLYRERLSGAGFPTDFGLFQGNTLIRGPEAQPINEAWWEEITSYSIRDQVSLPFVLWREGVDINHLPHEMKLRYSKKGSKHLRTRG